ncbi:Cullin 3 [Schizosaccharomyces cryophilus OY26]|uniref:Cullin 3 n=1 Tax=Schizosaccharomyces cryophilus (strain OY26 / ATCC MYA-4695 / CBS 11777 / NBRC 106824 / NRRL Y48691) TaxID=653667 RepID=S9X7B0_SCHCR|nr:Cullin 3 [Schizosaccharomyces cryophilus OY26]EPY49661.1 Cullin 3 [Schizosaccharomyces cryophilus OY26]
MQRSSKVKIRAPRKFTSNQVDYNAHWDVLHNAVQDIFHKSTSQLSFEELYRNAYKLVLHKHGERLYSDVKEVLRARLENEVALSIAGNFGSLLEAENWSYVRSKDDFSLSMRKREAAILFLSNLVNAWKEHLVSMQMISSVLKYLDKVYSKISGVMPIYDAGLIIFRDSVLLSSLEIGQKSVICILTLVYLERIGDSINRPLINSCLDMLNSLPSESKNESLYDVLFTSKFLDMTRVFYREEAHQNFRMYGVLEYLEKTNSRLEEEKERAQKYLFTKVSFALLSVVENELLTQHLDNLLGSPVTGFFAMLDSYNLEGLSSLYNMFSIVELGIPSIKRFFASYISEKGKLINSSLTVSKEEVQGNSQVITKVSTASSWVTKVLDLWDKLREVVVRSMKEDRYVLNSLSDSFANFINAYPRAPEFTSLFIDDNLKKDLKGRSEESVEKTLQNSVVLFRFLSEKDVFEKYYKTHLAKRLLNNRSISDDAELSMIGRLKQEAGNVFTQKLEGMFTDMRLSKELLHEYKGQYDQESERPPFELNVSVLASSFWPIDLVPEKVKCEFPESLKPSIEHFSNFYFSKHTGRKLIWYPSMGSADVRVQFRKRKHDLNVSTIALIILLQFQNLSESESLSYEELLQRTKIEPGDLKRNLQSLSCAKYKILLKEPKSRDINAGDQFTFNDNFTSNMARLKISTVAQVRVEDDGERKRTMEKVDESRKHQADACIVRVMKDRKTLEHNQLVAEVTRQLSSRFQPNPIMIKRRIEALIEREYLQRSAENGRIYEYLA